MNNMWTKNIAKPYAFQLNIFAFFCGFVSLTRMKLFLVVAENNFEKEGM